MTCEVNEGVANNEVQIQSLGRSLSDAERMLRMEKRLAKLERSAEILGFHIAAEERLQANVERAAEDAKIKATVKSNEIKVAEKKRKATGKAKEAKTSE